MHQRLASDERDSHCAEVADFADPKFQVRQLRMRPTVVVFRAIGAIEIAAIGQIKTALERLAIEEALAGLEDVITGKLAADVLKQCHESIRVVEMPTVGAGRNTGRPP